ncbi:MAG: trypsin-like serine peptidase [Solirubrobacterales bacterium]
MAGLLAFTAAAAIAAAPARAGVWVPSTSASDAGAFWTPQRMREAKPLEVKRPRPRTGAAARASARGRPHRVPTELPRLTIEASGFEQVADPTAPEYRINGAIFLSFGIFGYARCSGTAVHSGNQSVVFTAAHCINDGGRHGRWFKGRWVFVPGYRYGQRPFGVFPARWIDTTKQWRRSGSENFDVGAAVVGPNERGETLGEAVGGAGIAWNLKARQTFDIHGYPVEEPFDGETQRICRDEPFLGHDPDSFLFPGPLNLAVACGVTGGASGGGWTIDGNTLNSVTNYGYFDDTSPDFGAYFGNEVARLYGRAEKVR